MKINQDFYRQDFLDEVLKEVKAIAKEYFYPRPFIENAKLQLTYSEWLARSSSLQTKQEDMGGLSLADNFLSEKGTYNLSNAILPLRDWIAKGATCGIVKCQKVSISKFDKRYEKMKLIKGDLLKKLKSSNFIIFKVSPYGLLHLQEIETGIIYLFVKPVIIPLVDPDIF